jgi:PPP family 3-phenylpropionic acid transporter
MPQLSQTTPYWRLSGFYFFYFAGLGTLLPYWNPYLKTLGYSSFQIGLLMAIVMGTKIIAPNLWGWLADKSGKRMSVVRLASLLSVICFAGVFIDAGYYWLILVMFSFSFFWNASLPQFEATTLNHLGTETHAYNVIRIWGSIGFIVLSVGVGYLVDWKGIAIVPMIMFLLFMMIWFSSLLVNDHKPQVDEQRAQPFRQILARREVIALLLSCFLVQASHGPYYTFYSIYLSENGYASTLIGSLWALGVIAEIVVFLLMFRWLPALGARKLLLIAFLLTTLRWLLLAFTVEHLFWLINIQLMHAASFGIVHAVAIHLVHQYFIGQHQGKGQALYSSLSFGAGGAIGSLYSGLMWESVGATSVFVIAAGFSLSAFVISWYGVRD